MRIKVPTFYSSKHDLIIFEDRPKDYGAFQLRGLYYTRLKKSFILTIVFIVIILLLPWFCKLFSNENKISVLVNLSGGGANATSLPEPPGLHQKSISNLATKRMSIPQVKEKLNSDTSHSISQSNGTSNSGNEENSYEGNGGNGDGFSNLEIQPSFPGGVDRANEFIRQNINYSSSDRMNGTVIVGFIVGMDGEISDIHIIKSLSPALDKAAIEVIKAMPEWKPGYQNGKRVDKVPVQISIGFTI